MNAASEGPTYDDLLIQNEDEIPRLLNCIHHMPKRPRSIDLLEVYTVPTSKLTDEMQRGSPRKMGIYPPMLGKLHC